MEGTSIAATVPVFFNRFTAQVTLMPAEIVAVIEHVGMIEYP
jgi:hypothetical protein